jgi:hypothetical protein
MAMTAEKFRGMLAGDADQRRRACQMLAEWKVSEWLDDGREEVVRCLACWMDNGLDLGDDELLVELAQACLLVEGG